MTLLHCIIVAIGTGCIGAAVFDGGEAAAFGVGLYLVLGPFGDLLARGKPSA